MTQPRLKVLFLVTEDWYFCSHRLSLACAVRDAGYVVVVATRVQDHGHQIIDAGLTLLPIRMRRGGRNPLAEIQAIIELVRLYRLEKPDLVHHVALKPVLYGSIAAWITQIKARVNAIAGLGYIFSSQSWRAKLLKSVIRIFFRVLLNRPGTRVILQNPDDSQMMVNTGILQQDRAVLIRGSGVDLGKFTVAPEHSGLPVVLLASRMLWDKGVGEFVTAAKRLYEEGVKARFVLVGDGDLDNPASIPNAQLSQWVEEGVVEWWGRRQDMPEVFAQAHIICLPSYREGLPKVLLEAAACGRPIVATDVPGCREIVKNGGNGLLVSVRDTGALASAIKTLIENPKLRHQMGTRSRELAVAEFSVNRVVSETLTLYREMLS